MPRANVYCREILAGVLTKNSAGYSFQYLPEYLASGNPPISLSLPKQSGAFESQNLFPFFFGLLAEGSDMALECRLLKIDEKDHFTRLLKTCGVETISGVTIREAL